MSTERANATVKEEKRVKCPVPFRTIKKTHPYFFLLRLPLFFFFLIRRSLVYFFGCDSLSIWITLMVLPMAVDDYIASDNDEHISKNRICFGRELQSTQNELDMFGDSYIFFFSPHRNCAKTEALGLCGVDVRVNDMCIFLRYRLASYSFHWHTPELWFTWIVDGKANRKQVVGWWFDIQIHSDYQYTGFNMRPFLLTPKAIASIFYD